MTAAPYINSSPQPKPAGLRDCDVSFAGEPSGSQPFLGVSSQLKPGLRASAFLEAADDLRADDTNADEAVWLRTLSEFLNSFPAFQIDHLAHEPSSPVSRNTEKNRRFIQNVGKEIHDAAR
jgi:hypothetical protein